MRNQPWTRRALLCLSAALMVGVPLSGSGEDIDIFSVDEVATVNKPNVLFVLDNSSNWSRQSQKWPGGLTQGQSEVRAIKNVLNSLPDNVVNVGILEHRTQGSSGDNDGAFIRYHIRSLNSSNKVAIGNHLDTIFNDINGPVEKRNSGNPFGNLFWDVYNYLSGGNVTDGGAGTPSTRADSGAYTSAYSKFRSPLTTNDTCTRTVVIFLGNNVSNGPTRDSTANQNALAALGGDTREIPFADYVINTSPSVSNLGYSDICYSDVASCTADNSGTACTEGGFTSCYCDSTDFISCPLENFNVLGINSTSTTTTVSDDNPGVTTTGVATGDEVSCANKAPSPIACPASSSSSSSGPGADETTTQTTSWTANSCNWVSTGGAGCNGKKENYELRGTQTVRTVVTRTTTAGTQDVLGQTSQCYADTSSCSTSDFSTECASYDSCICQATGDTTGCGAGSTKRYQIKGESTNSTAEPTGTFSAAPSGPFMGDEWTRFLRAKGVPVPGSSAKTQVTTYTIDVFNAQQNADFSGLLFNMARVGGGKYYQAKNESQIEDALRNIFTEIQAVNSAFSSASLPVNATNRAQNENQVFIGLFRPDRTKRPLWFGNMKRYQIINQSGDLQLGDKNGNSAINEQTGFLSECAVSFWTTDSGAYWSDVITDDPNASGICQTSGNDPTSDLPDGPFVEKGAVAEVLRKGNNPSATPDADGNYAVNRTIKSIKSGALVDFNASNFSGIDATVMKFIRGEDTEDDDLDASTSTGLTETRSTIHGDVIHSRPQPVNYGGSTGVVVYYGSNDGMFRAVQASTGKELWSFVAPEHHGKLERLRKNAPNIRYYGDTTAGLAPKDYFFDGSTGIFQNADDSKIWIFPAMRRGGRKVYAFNVTNPASPQYLWSKGCPNLTNDIGCDSGFSDIGQTWSLPNAAFIEGYSSTKPVLVFGGGYDACEDADSVTPSCSSAKGRGVYVVDAETGAIVRHFDFSALTGVSARSVIADVAMLDVNFDGKVDYAYAADLGGNIFRMDFVDTPSGATARTPGDWRLSRVAYTNSGARKFFFAPALLQSGNDKVYLALGSGDREHPLESQYPYSLVVNRFYTFIDDLLDVDPVTSTNLDDTTVMADYTSSTGCGSQRILPGNTQKGWFMSLNAQGQGEQVVTGAVIAGGQVFFSTNRPTPTSSTACENSLGEARGYIVNLFNASGAIGASGICDGVRSTEFIGGGLPPSPVIASVPVDGQVKTIIIGGAQKDGAVSSAIEAQHVRPAVDSKRNPVYWYKSSGGN